MHTYAQNMHKYANQICINTHFQDMHKYELCIICRNMQKDKYAIICKFKYA